MRKKTFALMMMGIMVLGLSACGGKKEDKVESKTYTVSFNQNNGNTTDMPAYQFLGGDLSGLLNYESRLYSDITLTLNEDGTYNLKSDNYTSANDKRIEVGAEDGIGMVCVLMAEGTYEDNGDGTVTASKAKHVNYELETDVYSKETVAVANLYAVPDENEGTYDSDEYENILSWVPATTFTLDEENKAIETYTQAE